jgi:Cys-tRNA(Pro)/Cys-tRNA(Cys) deacylase
MAVHGALRCRRRPPGCRPDGARYPGGMAGRETQATRVARKAGIAFALHEYAHEPGAEAYALEAVRALDLVPERVFKTLLVLRGDELLVCVVPAPDTLDLRSLGKRAAMAPVDRAERVTGYVAGGISPLGQRRRLPTLVDDTALAHDTIFVSAGRRGLEIELAPADLVALTGADVRPLRRAAGG